MEKEQITSEAAPTIAVFYDGSYYIYDGNKDSKEEMLHFINRVINPIVQLKTDEDVENFLDVNKEWQEKTKFFESQLVNLASIYKSRKTKTRVIAFIYDKSDFPEELTNLRLTGRLSAKRDDLRIGLVTDKKIIKKYKAKYGSLWFPEGTYSTLILKRYDGQVYHIDLLSDDKNFMYWINKKSITNVEEMVPETFRIFEILRQPILVAFVDLDSKSKKEFKDSVFLIDEVLKEVAPAFFHGLIVSYADNKLYNRHRKLLGITHSKVPAISINNHGQQVIPYPEDEEISVQAIS